MSDASDGQDGCVEQVFGVPVFDRLTGFGVLSAALSCFCFLPYIVETLRGQTHPERASWLIWSVLGSISLASQIYEGADASLWFAAIQVGGTVVVCLLSIRFGAGSYLSRRNRFIFGAASIGLVSWYLAETAVYALGIAIAISLLGGCLTVSKSYRAPHSETLITWVMGWCAAICAIISVGAFDPVLLAYPLYLAGLYTAIIMAILLGRQMDANSRPSVDPIAVPVSMGAWAYPSPPERDVLYQVNEFAPEKDMQVPLKDEVVQRNHQ